MSKKHNRPADDGKAEQDSVLESVGITLPERRVYQVEIPNCLLGRKFVLAGSTEEAIEKYKKPCGITKHREPAKVVLTDFDPNNLPDGITLFGE